MWHHCWERQMYRPKLLDLFCGAGGAAQGFRRAGFYVVGVDIASQPNYCGDEFIQADALEYLSLHHNEFDAAHASPPCQSYSAMSKCRPGLAEKYPRMIGHVRTALTKTKCIWDIENVPGASLRPDLLLCGRMFGLMLYRHRIFECSFRVRQPEHLCHDYPALKAGRWSPGHIISVAGHFAPMCEARKAMGIDWMTRDEMAESIPPAYAEYVGKYMMKAIFLDSCPVT